MALLLCIHQTWTAISSPKPTAKDRACCDHDLLEEITLDRQACFLLGMMYRLPSGSGSLARRCSTTSVN